MNIPSENHGGDPSAQDNSSATVKIRRQRCDPFSRVPHAILEDDRLSWRAKGVMAYLLGRPENWVIKMRDIQNRSTEGRDAIRAVMRELKKAGYAKLVPRIDCGRMMGAMWEVTDISSLDEASPDYSLEPSLPTDGFSGGRESSRPESRLLNKKDGTKKDCTKNESKESKETPSVEGAVFSAEWKPKKGSKADKLKRIRVPSDYPSEQEFDTFLETQSLDGIATYRPDLYSTLCDHKWHQWKERLEKWVPIRDWRTYVTALDEHLLQR